MLQYYPIQLLRPQDQDEDTKISGSERLCYLSKVTRLDQISATISSFLSTAYIPIGQRASQGQSPPPLCPQGPGHSVETNYQNAKSNGAILGA